MNKYTVKATAQITAVFAFAALVSFATLQLLEYFKPTPETLVFGIMMLVLAYTTYNLIKIQASTLEFRERNRK